MIFIVTMVACLSQVNGRSHCVGTCYSGRLQPEAQEIFRGKHLKGYSYSNITTDNPVKCYRHCVQDCRCKACQMKDAKCELLDEDKTSKADDFKDEPGYVYFDLKQTMYQGESHMVPAGVSCYNGCCRSQPCMNGGTCVEQCKSPKEKFTCKCPFMFLGNVCEKISSCLGVLKSAPTGMSLQKGIYEVFATHRKEKIRIFCDFEPPNIAWTLFESFSKNTNEKYKAIAFHQSGFWSNFMNPPESQSGWNDYRLGSKMLEQIHADSSMFRATCDFPNRNGVLKPDYLSGYLSDYDIVTHGDLSDADGECKKYFYINIRGHEFHNVTVPTWHRKGGSHLHIGYPLYKSPPLCGFQPLPGSVNHEACFGYYGGYNVQFKCTATGSSTTQWWLGGKI